MLKTVSVLLAPGLLVAQTPAAPPMIPLTREMQIDGKANRLGYFSSFAVSRDGKVLIPQFDRGTFLAFDAQGRPLGDFGKLVDSVRPNRRSVPSFGWTADTLWAFDQESGKTFFTAPSGKVIRVEMGVEEVAFTGKGSAVKGNQLGPGYVSMPDPSGTGRITYTVANVLRPLARFGNGDMLVSYSGPRRLGGFAPGTPMPEALLIRTDRDGVHRATLGTVPRSRPSFCDIPYAVTATSSRNFPLPNCPSQFLSVAPDGSRVIIIRQDNRIPAPGEVGSYDILALGSLGDTIYARTFYYVADSLRQASLRLQLDQLRARLIGDEVDSLIQAVEVPKTLPAVRGLMVGLDGSMWHFIRNRWEYLTPAGQSLGWLVLPRANTLVAANRTHFWTIEGSVGDSSARVVRFRIKP